MKVHVFQNDQGYNLALYEFLQRNFNLSDHLFIFQSNQGVGSTLYQSDQVIYLPGFKNLFKIKRIISGSEKVYFHLLPMGPVIFFWFLNKNIFSKSVWIFWGADIYTCRLRHKSFKHFIYHLIRIKIIRVIPDIAGFLKGDFELIKKVYRTRATYHHVIYPIPTNFELCDKLKLETIAVKKDRINVLVGNSANESNRHSEALKILSKYRNEDLNILCPLSYGAKKKSYVKKIIKEGHSIFGSKFIPLLHFIKPEDYLKLLHDVDVALMNHDRQQGLGNILSLLYLEKKVFLRPGTTSFDYFSDKKIEIFDILSIGNLSYKEFVSFNKADGGQNKNILKSEFSEDNYIKNWKHIIEL